MFSFLGDELESRPRKPPPGARIIKRQALDVNSNPDRVYREKQYLQNKVESLPRYLMARPTCPVSCRVLVSIYIYKGIHGLSRHIQPFSFSRGLFLADDSLLSLDTIESQSSLEDSSPWPSKCGANKFTKSVNPCSSNSLCLRMNLLGHQQK